MYIIVVGAGDVGYYLAKALLTQGHEVLLIERDPAKLERIEDELGSIGMKGDGCEAATIEEAGAERANLFVAVTDGDEDNLVACQVAKHRFNVPRTIARIGNPKNENLFKELGIDVTVSTTNLILDYIAKEMSKPPLLRRLSIFQGGEREIVEVTIPSDSFNVGRKIKDLSVPAGDDLILIVRKDHGIQLPTPLTVIEAEDRIVAVTTSASEANLHKVLTTGSL
jgi:trk system potassium uptake protein TrkA